MTSGNADPGNDSKNNVRNLSEQEEQEWRQVFQTIHMMAVQNGLRPQDMIRAAAMGIAVSANLAHLEQRIEQLEERRVQIAVPGHHKTQ